MLTFPDEVHLIWSRKITAAKTLFLLNRYIMILCAISSIFYDYLSSATVTVSVSCTRLTRISGADMFLFVAVSHGKNIFSSKL